MDYYFSIYSESQKILSPWCFLKFFPQKLRIFKQNFTRPLYVHIYIKLQNFIKLSLNVTKLCQSGVNGLPTSFVGVERNQLKSQVTDGRHAKNINGDII